MYIRQKIREIISFTFFFTRNDFNWFSYYTLRLEINIYIYAVIIYATNTLSFYLYSRVGKTQEHRFLSYIISYPQRDTYLYASSTLHTHTHIDTERIPHIHCKSIVGVTYNNRFSITKQRIYRNAIFYSIIKKTQREIYTMERIYTINFKNEIMSLLCVTQFLTSTIRHSRYAQMKIL